MSNPSRVLEALLSSIQYLKSIYNLNLSISNTIIASPVPFMEFSEKYFEMFPGTKTIQTFDDHGNDTSKARIFHFTEKMPVKMITALCNMNEHGIGVYMSVNETDGKGRKSNNVIRIRSLFADMDGAPLEGALPYEPTLIVESSPGRYHCYWFTDDTPLEAFGYMQKRIAAILGSDSSVHDLPRVLRVPGFLHQKKKPFLTRVHGGTAKIYTYRELVEMFPPEKVKQFSAKRYVLKNTTQNNKEFRGKYGTVKGERHHHVIKRVGGMIRSGKSWDYIESEIVRECDACEPPLEGKEIEKLVKSASRYYGAMK